MNEMKKRLMAFAVLLLAAPVLPAQTVSGTDAAWPARTVSETGDPDPVSADSPAPVSEKEKFPRWRLSLQGGAAYRSGPMDPSLDGIMLQHAKRLRWGAVYGADATYYFTRTWGVGVEYSDMASFNRERIDAFYDDGSSRSGFLESRIDVAYLGPMFSVRMLSQNGRHALISNCGVGYVAYLETGELIEPYSIRGRTAGARVELGYEFCLNRRLFLGAMVSATTASLYELEMKSSAGDWQTVKLDRDEAENLSRLALSVGLRWYL